MGPGLDGLSGQSNIKPTRRTHNLSIHINSTGVYSTRERERECKNARESERERPQADGGVTRPCCRGSAVPSYHFSSLKSVASQLLPSMRADKQSMCAHARFQYLMTSWLFQQAKVFTEEAIASKGQHYMVHYSSTQRTDYGYADVIDVHVHPTPVRACSQYCRSSC